MSKLNSYYLKYQILRPFLSWQNKFLKHDTAKGARGSGLYDKTVKEIAEYTKEAEDIVRAKHHSGPKGEQLYRIFNDQKVLTRTNVEQFYQNCSYYLYELPLWNAEKNRPEYLYRLMLPYFKKYHCHDLLDFGGGGGDLSIKLASQGYKVSYCDIGEALYRFAEYRFKRRNLPITMFKVLNHIKEGSFDAVISFDCFEHVKDLPSIVSELVKLIRRGGLLIFSDAFEGGGLHLEENYQYKDFKNVERLMNDANLYFVGKFAQHYFYQKRT